MRKNVDVLIKEKERQYEGLRCSLGLLLEGHQVNMYILGHEIDLDEVFLDNMAFIDEMGGARYSDVAANVDKHGFRPVKLKDVPGRTGLSDVTIPF